MIQFSSTGLKTCFSIIGTKESEPNARVFYSVFSFWFFHQGSFRQNRLNFASFSFLFGVRVCLASVSVNDVRDVVNVSSAEVPDAKVLKMIKHAEVTLELETDKEITYSC